MIIKKLFIKKRWLLLPILSIIYCLGIYTPTVNAQSSNTTYIIGTDTTYAPFEFVDENGDLVGIEMDLLEAIAENQNFDYEVRVLGFNAAVQALESGQVHGVLAGMGITEERQEAFDFAEPHFNSTVQFAVRADSDIQSVEDLEGKTVAVKTGTSGAAVAQELQDELNFEISTFEDSVNMYEDVMVGNSDAAVEDYPVMAYAINTGQVNMRILEEELLSQPFGFAVMKGENQDLLQMFNEGLTNVKASGQYEEIVERYLGQEALESQTVEGGFFNQIINHGPALLRGLGTTLWVTFISFIIAFLLGVIIGLCTKSSNGLLQGFSEVYIDLFRGVPLIVLSFFIYFGLPQLTGINFGATIAGIITLSLNASAYISEIVRGGIEAVDRGQAEAGRSLGLSNGATMRHVIIPQAFRIMIPSFINQFVITLKDTSILSVIGLVELTQTGKIIIARTYQSGSMWFIVGLMYVVVITILTKISKRLEKRPNTL